MDYVAHLAKDKKMATIISGPLEPLQARHNIPLRLMASIMGQQLSTKVAKVIYHRFLELFDGAEPTPQQVLAMQPDVLRAIGLSHAKVSYVQNVARFCIDHNIQDDTLLFMPDEAIVALLTQIKGVGRWTVEMLLMFTLGREDVFAPDDLGIQQAMTKLYHWKQPIKKH